MQYVRRPSSCGGGVCARMAPSAGSVFPGNANSLAFFPGSLLLFFVRIDPHNMHRRTSSLPARRTPAVSPLSDRVQQLQRKRREIARGVRSPKRSRHGASTALLSGMQLGDAGG
jgi:hypothetical protein